jgi:hypothetical protein
LSTGQVKECRRPVEITVVKTKYILLRQSCLSKIVQFQAPTTASRLVRITEPNEIPVRSFVLELRSRKTITIASFSMLAT